MVLKHDRKTLGHAVVYLLVMFASPAISKDFGILTRMLYLPGSMDATLRRTVRLVALLNLSYFGVEFAVALSNGSVSLFADSIDFLEDASVNFLIFAALEWSAARRARVGMALAGIPVHNVWGLRPALVKGTNEIAPLTAFRDIDKLGLLKNVATLNFHPHLPHYELTTRDTKSVHLLARQPIDPDRPHPFTTAGNTEFNCLLWMPPNQQRAGDIVLVDSTNFTTLFGGTDSLANFWRNLALMK